ncbi:MAG TPA: tetratricopeptide repeat protein [Thermoanaerobaculia bacterium]|nr:tetratricopeptide repeat protein [Thermoanaerobaculia bacterium]
MSDLIHPSNGELEAFMLGRLSQRENRRVILHLLHGCRRCQTVTAAFWSIGTEPPAEWRERHPYDSTFQSVFDRVCQVRDGLEAERAEARQLFAELKALPAGRWVSTVQKDARFHTWGFCELLLDQALDGDNSEIFAGLALHVAVRIHPESHPPVFLAELRARAWSRLSDVRRRTGDLDGSEEALHQAEACLLRGTGDRLEKARLLERKAALRHAQERSEEAARLLGRAILLYRRAGQWDQVGRVLLSLGCVPAPGRLRLLWRRLTSRSRR